MSECISSRGEYSSHEYENGICNDCGHLDLDKVRTATKAEALREAVAEFENHVGIGEFAEQSTREGRPWTHADEAWELQGPFMDWLRNRADTLEES